MLTSGDRRFVVSSLGWVDKSALWVYDAGNEAATSVPLGDAKYLSLFPCTASDHFTVLHHYDGSTVRLTVHAFTDPATPLCSLERKGEACRLSGEINLLREAPRYYTAYFDPGQAADYYLLQFDSDQETLAAERFDWFDNSYDKGYQGIVGVTELPSGLLIVSVQRDSHPVLYDPVARRVVRKLKLADRLGNPSLHVAVRRREVWADDYDTLVRLDLESLKVKQARRLQGSDARAMRFIGHWSLDREELLCLVARPYSGDVVAISTRSMRIKYAASVGKQPLEAALLNGKRVIARDWMSGALLRGSFRRAWFR